MTLGWLAGWPNNQPEPEREQICRRLQLAAARVLMVAARLWAPASLGVARGPAHNQSEPEHAARLFALWLPVASCWLAHKDRRPGALHEEQQNDDDDDCRSPASLEWPLFATHRRERRKNALLCAGQANFGFDCGCGGYP